VGNGVKKPGGGYCDDGRLPPDAWEIPELGGKKSTQEIVCAVCERDLGPCRLKLLSVATKEEPKAEEIVETTIDIEEYKRRKHNSIAIKRWKTSRRLNLEKRIRAMEEMG
jgi:hypothetical protein